MVIVHEGVKQDALRSLYTGDHYVHTKGFRRRWSVHPDLCTELR